MHGGDSGHQMSLGFGRGQFGGGPAGGAPPPPNGGDEWALNEEAIQNLGYMQLKKTHDAAMVLVQRMHGEKLLSNWIPPVKVNAIRGEFMRQCDKLDGRVDGIINNY